MNAHEIVFFAHPAVPLAAPKAAMCSAWELRGRVEALSNLLYPKILVAVALWGEWRSRGAADGSQPPFPPKNDFGDLLSYILAEGLMSASEATAAKVQAFDDRDLYRTFLKYREKCEELLAPLLPALRQWNAMGALAGMSGNSLPKLSNEAAFFAGIYNEHPESGYKPNS